MQQRLRYRTSTSPNSDRPQLKAIAFILKHGMGMKRWRLRLFS
ncbi:hypothetical protein [Dolichospermum circinale]|nr:hypothetical protein [Dolichospermum circinale]MDB9456374.1 hypothetical protein [Dolichospermum circinale CS-541/06]MDB9461464.1 hypothetical protein [Dolichospermum circinale CS-541/04]MDB9547513.1 hypothetical protein [Dolichospermum circinale CS-1031]